MAKERLPVIPQELPPSRGKWDATLRNIRVLKKQLSLLGQRVRTLETRVKRLEKR